MAILNAADEEKYKKKKWNERQAKGNLIIKRIKRMLFIQHILKWATTIRIYASHRQRMDDSKFAKIPGMSLKSSATIDSLVARFSETESQCFPNPPPPPQEGIKTWQIWWSRQTGPPRPIQ